MTTANKITIVRICMIPLVVFFYLATFIPWNAYIAGMLFILAAFTDFLDGYFARKNDEVTDLGKFLDAIADKMLTLSAIVMIVALPVVERAGNLVSIVRPQWLGIVFAVLILAREFAVSALRMVAAAKGVVLAAEKSGKIKAAFTYVTITLYFFYEFYVKEFYISTSTAHHNANAVIGIVLIVLFGISALLTLSSGYSYFAKNWQVFSDKKTENRIAAAAQSQNVIVKSELAIPAGRPQKAKAANAQKPKTTKRKTQKRKTPKPQQKQQTEGLEKDKRGRVFDELIPQALEMFWEKGWASTTMLQKHLGVGYPRASKIVDQMEEKGLISANDGAKTRKVLVTKEQFQNMTQKKD